MYGNERGESPIIWSKGASEETAQRPYEESQYLLPNTGMSKIYQQNAIEEARLERSMRRDEHKSFLKMQELREKLIRRESHLDIVEKEGAMYALMLDGLGEGIGFRKVFSAKIKCMDLFRYQGTSDIMWQIILIEEKTGTEVISSLYAEEDLMVTAKLKRTILAAYDCSDSVKIQSFFWNWVQKHLLFMLQNADVIEIPSNSGWFLECQSWHCYSMADEDTIRFTGYMRNFVMQRFENLQDEEIVGKLLEDFRRVYGQEDVGLLLQFRLLALMGRLTGRPCFQSGIVIWGEKSEQVARTYLSTMQNDVDTINLDSDGIRIIRERVCNLQDTPVIFLVNDPANKSVKNRLREVISWMQTGRIEGGYVKAPFVFCFKHFSASVPIADMLVLDASKIWLPQDDQILAKFQCVVVEKIEQTGELWVDEIAGRYVTACKNGYCKAHAMAKTVTEVICKMFDEPNVDITKRIELRKLLEAGEEEIRRQLSQKSGRLTELFREKVTILVEQGTIFVADRNKAPVDDEQKYIYYDTECYYFTENVLRTISIWAKLERKTILLIKQELDGMSMLKKYKAFGQRTEEMHIDFRICNAYSERKDLSGLAVQREFFDEVGGIALCERG